MSRSRIDRVAAGPTATKSAATRRRLRERGVAVSSGDHGSSKALYFDGPGGNGLEVYLDAREGGGRPSAAAEAGEA